MDESRDARGDRTGSCDMGRSRGDSERPSCPVCGGRLVEIRAKLQCADCHRICESCCEGGRG